MPSMSVSQPQVTLVSCDEVPFILPHAAILPSSVLYHICLDLNPQNTNTNFNIPLPIVHSKVLNLVVEWLDHHHKEHPDWPQQGPLNWQHHSILARGTSWDTEFLTMCRSSLYDLILVADYLSLTSLQIVCKDYLKRLLQSVGPHEVAQVLSQS